MRFPTLSKPHASGLALCSFGMIIVRSCSLSSVANVLSPMQRQSFNTFRERLRDAYWEIGGESLQQLAIAMDATDQGDCFVILSISVVYRGCATSGLENLKSLGTHALKPK